MLTTTVTFLFNL